MKLLYAAEAMLSAYKEPIFIKIKNDAVVIREIGSETVAFVLGSNDSVDWLCNFDTIPTHYLDSWYHRGFFKPVPFLIEVFKAYKINLIVGHSRGAAIGSIISRITNLPCIAFNCPRPLWLGWKRLQTPCIAVQAEADFICKVPGVLTGYRPIGTCLWFPGRAFKLTEDHRMMWMIDKLKDSPFGLNDPFEILDRAREEQVKSYHHDDKGELNYD